MYLYEFDVNVSLLPFFSLDPLGCQDWSQEKYCIFNHLLWWIMDTNYPAHINPDPQDPAPSRWRTDIHLPYHKSSITFVQPSVCYYIQCGHAYWENFSLVLKYNRHQRWHCACHAGPFDHLKLSISLGKESYWISKREGTI